MAEFINRKHKANRLIYEKSPYLLQHAYNLVDWFAWRPEASQKAQREYKRCSWPSALALRGSS